MRIEVDRVHVRFPARRGGDGVVALEDVSFRVDSGEFVAVLGPSGCGKSTLLSVVAGLLPPSAGEVRFIDVGAGPAAVRGGEAGEGRQERADDGRALTAMVFQEFALFPWRTVLDNVTFGLEVRGVPRARRQEAGREWLGLVGLGSAETRLPAELSGGMKQRVGIARALAVGPRVLLMDEPLSALDAQTRALLQQDLLDLWSRTGQTVVYVTHNIEEAAFLADRVILMTRRPGRVRMEVAVPFGRPRTEALMASAEFAAFTHRLWTLVRDDARRAMFELDGRSYGAAVAQPAAAPALAAGRVAPAAEAALEPEREASPQPGPGTLEVAAARAPAERDGTAGTPPAAVTVVVARRSPAPVRRPLSRGWLGAASVGLVLVFWEALTRAGLVPPLFLPRLSDVLAELARLVATGELAGSLNLSLRRIVLGWLAGSGAGFAVGLAIGLSAVADALLDPLIALTYPIPKIAILPLLVLWLGIGEPSKVAVIAIGVFFPVAVNTAAGVRGVDPTLVRAARSLGASPWQLVAKVSIVGALPTVFAGLRLGAGMALLLVVSAEMIAASAGLGFLILQGGELMLVSRLMAGILVLSALGIASNWALRAVEQRIVRWRH